VSRRPFVKVCGITTRNDAECAAGLGADALGFVFWPKSPRYIPPAAARRIIDGVGPLTTAVGIFVDARVDEIHRAVLDAQIDVVQLHGDEPRELLSQLTRPVIRAVGLRAAGPVTPIESLPPDVTVLLDVHDPRRRGGTGRQVDWAVAARWARQRRVILSGGLRPDNVRTAIRQVAPYGIDVSSGVESTPGTKDAGKLRAFFTEIEAERGSAATDVEVSHD